MIAARVRAKLDCAPDRPINGLEFFDQINSVEVEMQDGTSVPLETGIESLGDGREGLSRYNPDNGCLEILLSPETYAGLERSSPRAAYCLVHEFSHTILHGDQLRKLAELPQPSQIAFHRGSLQPHPMYLDTEWQANALAAAFLMPALGLSELEQRFGELTEALVTTRYHVSGKAAQIRINIYQERRATLLRNCQG
jgi:Zn-dependent peptidase ImmA (M78 family)